METPRNYFTRELLHNSLSSNGALHFNVKSLVAIFGGKLLEGSVPPAQYCPCGYCCAWEVTLALLDTLSILVTYLHHCLSTTIPVHPSSQLLLQRLITARLSHQNSLAQSSRLHYAVCYAMCVANMLRMYCKSSSKSHRDQTGVTSHGHFQYQELVRHDH